MIRRVGDRRSFVELARHGQRARRGPISVTYLPDVPDHSPRVAYAVGRAVGGAADRNRLRRRLRAVVAELGRREGPVGPGTYLIGAGPAASDLDHGALTAAVAEAVTAARSAGSRRDRP